MDKDARAQIRLILEDADAQFRRAIEDRLRAIYAKHAATGLLQSGATVKVSLTSMEELAAKLIAQVVDQVSVVAKDVEAFAMIQELVENALRFLDDQIEGVASMASGKKGVQDKHSPLFEAAKSNFAEGRKHLVRQLEIHRFAFTVPQIRAPSKAAASPTVGKSRGGKPLAAHWDEMWATLAVMLYEGDLQPKTQADVERAMKDWLAQQGIDAGDTAVRARARQLWQKLKASE